MRDSSWRGNTWKRRQCRHPSHTSNLLGTRGSNGPSATCCTRHESRLSITGSEMPDCSAWHSTRGWRAISGRRGKIFKQMSALIITRSSTSDDSKGPIILRIFMIMPGLRLESVDPRYLSSSTMLMKPYIAVKTATVTFKRY